MDISQILTIYGAIVATVALGWNILNALSQYKGRLKVERQRTIGFSSGKEIAASMFCRVANIGKTSRYIYMPKLDFYDYKSVSRQDLIDIDSFQIEPKPDYPRELKPGETHEINYDLETYYEKVLHRINPQVRLYFRVQDTHNVDYYSEKFSVGEIISDVEGCRALARTCLTRRSS
jgi:hypothetical protein